MVYVLAPWVSRTVGDCDGKVRVSCQPGTPAQHDVLRTSFPVHRLVSKSATLLAKGRACSYNSFRFVHAVQYLPTPLCQTSPFLLGGNLSYRDRANHNAGRADDCDFHGYQRIGAPNFNRRRIDLAEGLYAMRGRLRDWAIEGLGDSWGPDVPGGASGDLSSRSGFGGALVPCSW